MRRRYGPIDETILIWINFAINLYVQIHLFKVAFVILFCRDYVRWHGYCLYGHLLCFVRPSFPMTTISLMMIS